MIDCKFRIMPNTKRVIWAITNYCNYGCTYCIFASGKKHNMSELNKDTCLTIIDNLKDRGFNSIKFTGGEPFARPDMLDILEYVNNLNLNFDISTNAYYISTALAERLKHLKNLEFVHVSLDGHDTFGQESVRGKNTYLPTLKGLSILLEQQVPIRVGCLIHKLNENKLNDMVMFCEQLGVKHIAFSIMEPVGRLSEFSNLITTKKKEDIITDIKSINTNILITDNISHNTNYSQKECPGGDTFLYISADGKISPCPWVSEYSDRYNVDLNTLLSNTSSNLNIFNSRSKNTPHCPANDKQTFLEWIIKNE